MSFSAISVGVVGAGQIAHEVHLPVLSSMAGVRVAWIADVDGARARATADAFGVPHAALPSSPGELPACDVALLAIPVHVRDAYYRELGARGTAVLAEKPFAITVRDHEAFASAFEPSRVGCGYMRRFYRSSLLLRRAVAEGWFGPLHRIVLREGGRATRSGFDVSFQDRPWRRGGGVLLAIGCHGLDLALHVTGAAGFAVLEADLVRDGGTDRQAAGRVRLQQTHGPGDGSCELDFRVSWLSEQRDRLELQFERVTLVTGIRPAAPVEVRTPAGVRRGTLAPVEPGATTSYQAFYLEWREFLDGVARGRPSRIAAATAVGTTRLLERLLTLGEEP